MVQIFIFNYAHFEKAISMFDNFNKLGYNTYLLNCESKNDPIFEETDKIKKLPNIYYSGQWNEALKFFTDDIAFFINSDVEIKNYHHLMKRLEKFYDTYGEKAGIYAPNHYWTPWTYNPKLLEDIGDNLKIVPGTDSTIWSVCRDIAFLVGPIDLNINKLGWGIELFASWHCKLNNKLVIRDYGIKCLHPHNTSYDRHKADQEWREMAKNLDKSFWDLYHSRDKYGFNYGDVPLMMKVHM